MGLHVKAQEFRDFNRYCRRQYIPGSYISRVGAVEVMSRPVVLSVNGRNGSDVIDELQVEQNRELIVSIVDVHLATSFMNKSH